MEISRKKITDAEIHASEVKLAEAVESLTAEFAAQFAELGCELETEFSRDNDNFEGEERDALKELDIKEPCPYSFGYSSGVKITVKRIKAEEEEAQDALNTEGLCEEEAELAENERLLEEAKKEAARGVAFTSMYFVHIYKAFWRESVSMSENADEVRADLEEFIAVLKEKAENEGAEAEEE